MDERHTGAVNVLVHLSLRYWSHATARRYMELLLELLYLGAERLSAYIVPLGNRLHGFPISAQKTEGISHNVLCL